MDNFLLLSYNIKVNNIKKISDEEYHIDNIFYFLTLNRPIGDIFIINNILSKTKSKYHTIISNMYHNIVTKYDNKDFILIRVNTQKYEELDILDMLYNNIYIDLAYDALDRTNYSKLWESKIDYLEYQISELGKNHKLILESFSYFVGLGENAIEYFNCLKISDIPKVLSQRRVYSPNYNLNYYNPLNLIIDYRIRDIAEYIKSSFFSGVNLIDEIDDMLNKGILSDLECNLLFDRLLYPSNYFDAIYMVLEHGMSENILLKYINHVNDYEEYLNDIYKLIYKKTPLLKIDWLIK